MSSVGIASVDTYSRAIEKLLDRARQIKPQNGSEPALTATDFGGIIEEVEELSNKSFITNSQAHYAAIETACRNIFYDLLVREAVFQFLRSLIPLGVDNGRGPFLQRNLEFTRCGLNSIRQRY